MLLDPDLVAAAAALFTRSFPCGGRRRWWLRPLGTGHRLLLDLDLDIDVRAA